ARRGGRRDHHRSRAAAHRAVRPRVPRVVRQRLRARVALSRDDHHPARAAIRALRDQGGEAGLMAAAMESITSFVRRTPPGGAPHRNLTLGYADDLKLFRGPWRKVGLAILVFLYLWIPGAFSPYVLTVLITCGIYAIGAIGLNRLTGYAGQVSLGHAFFYGAGGYTAAYLGVNRGWPLPAYL